MTDILGPALVGVTRAQLWAASRGATEEFVLLAGLYWVHGQTRGRVRPEVAYAQAAKETGFGHFGGDDPVFSAVPAWHNPCGLKTADGSATQRFIDWTTGVIAHLDHLALYAGAPGYPRQATSDPRHFAYLHGTAPTVEQLSGRWSGAGYGETLVARYLAPLVS